jgi:hypothetical protein
MKQNNKLRGLDPRPNYTDRATVACQQIEDVGSASMYP